MHEPARDVEFGDIGSERIQKIIDDMVNVMRKAPGVGLAAPQIGIPLRVSYDFQFSFCLKWLKFDLFFGCLEHVCWSLCRVNFNHH